MLHVALTDDWELRGTGAGNMRLLQFEPMKRLTSIYEKHGLRGSFNVECMQQLYHIRFGNEYRELAELAEEWEAIVIDTYRRGHDVQLHIHSQWYGATYSREKGWILPAPWAITELPSSQVQEILSECKEYLEGLLRRVNPDYRCLTFRSGAWAVAPSPTLLRDLANIGIVFDMSIVSGLRYENKRLKLDYTNIDEGRFPYYPSMNDARRVSDKVEDIIVVPTHSFHTSFIRNLWQAYRWRRSPAYYLAPNSRVVDPSSPADGYSQENWNTNQPASRAERIWRDLNSTHRISDISALSFFEMKRMIQDARRKAREYGNAMPLIIENHTKDCGYVDGIEHFACWLTKQKDIKVLTLNELAQGLESGAYNVRHL